MRRCSGTAVANPGKRDGTAVATSWQTPVALSGGADCHREFRYPHWGTTGGTRRSPDGAPSNTASRRAVAAAITVPDYSPPGRAPHEHSTLAWTVGEGGSWSSVCFR